MSRYKYRSILLVLFSGETHYIAHLPYWSVSYLTHLTSRRWLQPPNSSLWFSFCLSPVHFLQTGYVITCSKSLSQIS